MLSPTLTHYAPWNQPAENFALCGVYVSADRYHSPQPTCPTCAAKLAADDAALEDAPLPVDDAGDLDVILNNGAPEPHVETFAQELFDFACALNAVSVGGRR
jgi:hypothetical protein